MFIDYVETPIGVLEIKAEEGLIVSLQPAKSLLNHKREDRLTNEAKLQISQYFTGQRKQFDLPIKLNGTDWQNRVWYELLRIPYGATASYEDIAQKVGSPKAYRAVGSANNRNLLPIIIPCHRVIAKNGALAGYALGVEKKEWLLSHEQR